MGKREEEEPTDAYVGASTGRDATPVSGFPRPERADLARRESKGLDRRKPILPTVAVRPHIEHILDDGLHLINEELARLKQASREGDIDGKVHRIHKAIQSLVLLSKEARERDKAIEAEVFTDEELEEVLKDG